MRTAVIAALADRSGGVGAIAEVCRACVEVLPVDGAAISAVDGGGRREMLWASDDLVSRIESVQFTLGEGPCVEAFRTRRPVLVPDLVAAAGRWPLFASEVAGHPIGAVFAFPIQYGAIGIGALDLYRGLPGWLSDDELVTALEVVDLAAVALLGVPTEDTAGEDLDVWLAPLSGRRAKVHQATGMLIAEFDISADRALSLLRGYAFTSGRLIEDVAHDITTRTLGMDELDR